MGITLTNDYKVDVDKLFGLARPNVQSVAGQGIQASLSLLQAMQSGQQSSPFSVEDVAHYQAVTDTYLREHPLGFLAESSPIIAQNMLGDALRRDVVRLMGAYNFANGNFKNGDASIAGLHTIASEDFAPTVQKIFTEIHRNILIKSAKDLDDMARTISDGLWGTSAHDERELQQQFKRSVKQLDTALALFDQKQPEAAMGLYADAMGDTEGYVTWFGRALRTSEQQKFVAHVGIAVAAGAAAYFTGGASLALMGGAEASLGAHTASMVIGGVGMTVTIRKLNSAVFDTPFLIPGTPFEKAVDFGGEVLHNTALMGWLQLGNVVGAALPIMEGEPVIAAAINATRSFTIELGAFTSFNMVASTENLINDRAPSIDDVTSRQAIVENGAFVLGLRAGHLGLNGAKFMARRGLNATFNMDVRIREFMRGVEVAPFLLSPLVMMVGLPGAFGTADSPVHNAFSTLLKTIGAKPNVIDIYQRRPHKFWGILNLLDMGVPSALVAYRILRLQADPHSESIMGEFKTLLQDTRVKAAVDSIRNHGMSHYLAANGIDVTSDKVRNGSVLMDSFALAYTKMQWYIDRYSAAATEAGHFVGIEHEGKTHFRSLEEVVWPDDEPYTPPTGEPTLSIRDRMAVTMRDDLIAEGLEAELVKNDDVFVYAPSPTILPAIFERYNYNGLIVKVEILTGTGAVIISVMPQDDPTKSKTEHVKGAKTVFEAAVEAKVARMVARALKLNTDEVPEEAIAILRGRPENYSRRHLINAKAKDNDIFKFWVTFNDDETATLTPVNGIFRNDTGDYVAGQTITIEATSYQEVQAWVGARIDENAEFARRTDRYKGVRVRGFGSITLTDEAHPYKEIVSPKLTSQNFATWLIVVNSLRKIGLTGTTPYNLVGTHTHGNLPMTLEDSEGSRFTILPVLGILRAFASEMQMLYDGIPSHDNRLGFIQRLPLWFIERLKDPSYVTDPTDRRQILRVSADLARDVKKYNAMNVSNHISALLAEMIGKDLFKDGETISDRWQDEDYNFRVIAGALSEAHDIVREIDCAHYSLKATADTFSISDATISDTEGGDQVADFFRNTLYRIKDGERFSNLQIGQHFHETVNSKTGGEYQLAITRTTEDTVTVTIKQQVHLIRVAKDARKTTAELRIFDAILDASTSKFFLEFYHAWSFWHGTGQFLDPDPKPSVPPIVEGGAAVFGDPISDQRIP